MSRDNTVLPAHPAFLPQAECDCQTYLPLPSHPQLVLIYRPRRDGRLSRPWREVAQAEIRTYNLPIANPALYQYHTTTSAHLRRHQRFRGTKTLVYPSTSPRCSCIDQQCARYRAKQPLSVLSGTSGSRETSSISTDAGSQKRFL